MSNIPDKQPPTIAEQTTQIGNNLKQLRQIIEEPEFTSETYQKVVDLTSDTKLRSNPPF